MSHHEPGDISCQHLLMSISLALCLLKLWEAQVSFEEYM